MSRHFLTTTLKLSKRAFVFAMLLCAFCWAAQGTNAQDRSKTSKYMAEAAVALSKLMGQAEDDGFRLEKSMTLAGGWVDKGERWTSLYQVVLQEGSVYRFMAAGDADATDVDIRLTDPDGNVVVSDVAVARTAAVNYRSTRSVYYTVQIRVYGSLNNVPCVCLTAVYKR